MEKMYQVFVSSTYEDLKEERQVVVDYILKLDCIPRGMEFFPAADDDQWTYITKMIDRCDYYVVIVGGRYGSISTRFGKSFTQLEYEYAVEQGKPILAFLRRPENIPASKLEPTEEGRMRLNNFRDIVQKKLCRYWDEASDLKGEVSVSLIRLIKNKPGVGLVSADLASEQGTSKEVERCKEKIDELERLLEEAQLKALTSQVETAAEKSGRGKKVAMGRVALGVERLITEKLDLLRGAGVGLICNQSSVNHNMQHVADLFNDNRSIKLVSLFGPQHGIRGEVQDNMVETAHALDRITGLPIYSLYSETREPTEQMLKGINVLVFDMQDVGCRIYTFVYTLANCMRAAAKYGKKVIVCDRPNPINGEAVAGTVLEPKFASFVGQFPLATRHGMTVCELARMFNEHFGIRCELETVLMEGWSRTQWLDETDAPWVMPSPNMPTLDSATVFPGTVHVEGTRMSEGRGTTRPFELVGAPYIVAEEYTRRLSRLGFPGVHFRGCGFQPTFQKYAGQTCGGVQLHVTDREGFEPVIVGVATVKMAYDLYTEHFRWKDPPYEYVYDMNPFDVIAGTDKLRAAIERGDSIESIAESWTDDLEEFKRVRERFLLY